MDGSWVEKFPGSIVVCDRDGVILEMNEKACEMYREQGGGNLIGQSLLPCHAAASRQKLRAMLEGESSNCYTTEKNGVKEFIYQIPWYKDKEYMGFVELLLEIPMDMPHFVRK